MLVRNGFNYLTYFEIVCKYPKLRQYLKKLSFSKVCLINTQHIINKHLDMDFPIITEAIETIKKGQKINPKEGFSIIVKNH